MLNQTKLPPAVLALLGLACFSMAKAEIENGAGVVTYVPTYEEAFQLPGDANGRRWHSKGVVISSDPDSTLHLSTQDCFGTSVTDDKGAMTQSGFCDAIDRDGDVWWIWWTGTKTGSNWGYLGGTGKFSGVEGGGTTTVVRVSEDGRTTISWEGTWSLKLQPKP